MDHIVDLTICVDNAAFGETYEDQAHEMARILTNAAESLLRNPAYLDPRSGHMLCLNDSNGNRVGHVTPKIL